MKRLPRIPSAKAQSVKVDTGIYMPMDDRSIGRLLTVILFHRPCHLLFYVYTLSKPLALAGFGNAMLDLYSASLHAVPLTAHKAFVTLVFNHVND